MKSILIFSVFLFFCLLPLNRADASIYQIHFRYDQNTKFLTFDESKSIPVSVDSDQDMNPLEFANTESTGHFVLAFLFDSGEEIVRRNFDPITDDTFVLDVPYFSSAKSLEIYRDGSNAPILSYDLSQFLTCNRNKICEYEKGENFDTCPDCIGTVVQFSEETKELLKQNNDVLTDPKTGEVLLRGVQPVATGPIGGSGGTGGGSVVTLIVGGIVLLLIIGGVVIALRLRKRNRQYGL